MFKELENTLNEIKIELGLYRQLFALSIDSLTTQKQVAKFLGVSQKTLYLYIQKSILVEGVHYVRNVRNKKIEFIPYKILEFKQHNAHKKAAVNVQHQINPIASKFLKQKHG